jgi:hypothetical protein
VTLNTVPPWRRIQQRLAGRHIAAVASAPAMDDLQHMATFADMVERIIGQQNIIAAVHAQPCASGVMDDIIDNFNIIRLL